MGKNFWPVLVIAVSLSGAGLWVARPRIKAAFGPAVSSFCSSFSAELARGWARLTAKDDDTAAGAFAVATLPEEPPEEPAALRNGDPDPSSMTPAQRKAKYMELVAAAKARKQDVMAAALSKSAEGLEALKATKAYHAKVAEMKRLEKRYGPADDRVAHARIELVALKEAVQAANERYREWKAAHKEETADPEADATYRELVARSRFYAD